MGRKTYATILSLSFLMLFAQNGFTQTFGTGPVQIALTSISATYTSTDIMFQLGFASPVVAPSLNSPNSLYGYVDLDTDQNPTTGIVSDIQNLGPGPALALGEDYYVDLGSELDHAGTLDIVDAVAANPIANVSVTYNGTSVTFIVPLRSLGNSNGLLNYGAIVGTSTEATSELPIGTVPLTSENASTVPEPSSPIIFATGGICGVGWLALRQRRKRRIAS